MEETDAVQMDNWFPEETRVRVRSGSVAHATGLGASVESLLTWNGPTSSKMFGAISSDIYEVTSAGAVGAADVSSLTGARWQQTIFAISSGHYLYIANGADTPRYYDGSSWTTSTFTGSGLTTSDLVHVNSHKARLWFVEKDTMNGWYGTTEAISGTLTKFDFGPQTTKGGYLVAMGTWTIDAGSGVDDLACFVTSEGEVVIYAGTDPGSASTWAKIGTFRTGKPIGRRCLLNIGSDLIIVTENGFYPLSRILRAGDSSKATALSDKISNALFSAVASSRDVFGWEPVFHPAGNKMLVNVPGAAPSVQFVRNLTTGAWCRFTDWDAQCWGRLGNDIYYGDESGNVIKADTGNDDDGADIVSILKPAFSYFKSRGRSKRFAMAKPNYMLGGSIAATTRINVDFADDLPSGTPVFTALDGATWDTATWDTASWSTGAVPYNRWQSVEGKGYAASLAIKTLVDTEEVFLNSIDWLYEPTKSAGYI